MKTIIAFISGGIVFMIFLLVIGAHFILSLIMGIVCTAALYLILVPPKKTDRLTKEEKNEFGELLKDGYGKLGFINAISYRIENKEIQEQISKISNSAKWILDYLKKNPKEIRTCRRFLTYYLDTSLNIVQKYQGLESGIDMSDDTQNKLTATKDAIVLLQKSFAKQISKLVDNDLVDIDVELELLKRMVESEGIKDE